MFTLAELDNVIPLVRAIVPPTPQYAWPLLKALTGVEIVVKHENHTPIGAFKLRGGIVYFDRLKRARPQVQGIVTATRGNHGQSLAFAGTHAGIAVTIVVPHGNSTEKNAAMRAFGAELIEHGRDFDEAKEAAIRIATERGLEYAPSFHRDFVIGVATYAHELYSAVDNLDTVYVPIGLGSGICGMIGTRDALGLKTKIVGVVAEAASAYLQSFTAGRGVATNSSPMEWRCACPIRQPSKLFAKARNELSRSRTTKSPRRLGTSTVRPTTAPRVPVPRRWQH